MIEKDYFSFLNRMTPIPPLIFYSDCHNMTSLSTSTTD